MKHNLLTLPMVLAFAIFLSNCSKPTKETVTPVASERILKYKMLEYQTNEPLYMAVAEFGYCTPYDFGFGGGCASYGVTGDWYSDSNGDITMKYSDMPAGSNNNYFMKEGYWTKGHMDTSISTSTQDSGVVRLFPISWIKIHLKNEVSYAIDTNISLSFDVVYDSIKNDYSPGIRLSYSSKNLDTTLVFKTFGNIKNKVIANIENSGIILRELYSSVKFINRKDTVVFEVILK